MISLKKILNEVLNNFSVGTDMFVDPNIFITEIINEIRLKFVTRGKANDMLQQFLDDALAQNNEDTIRIQGVKSMKFREGTLKRI